MLRENKDGKIPRKGYNLVKGLFGKIIEIPQDWEQQNLEEIGTIIGGGTPDSYNKEYWNGKILWAVPTDITKLQTNQIEDTKRKITKQGLENSSAKLLPEGTILITSRATIGKCAITTKPISTNQGFQNIVCNNDYDNSFIFYSIKHNRNKLLRLSYGTTFLEISKSEIKKVLVPIPNSIPEQQKIASILSRVDACIESTQKVIDQTILLKTGLMQKLLTRGIGHVTFKKVPWLFGKEIQIPEGWEVNTFDDVCEFIISGTNARSDLNDSGEIRYIHYGDIHTKWNIQLDCDLDEIPQIDKEKVSRLQLLKEGDLIIADASEDVEGSGTSISLKNVKNKKIVAGLHTLVLRRKDENTSFGFMKYLTSVSYVKIQITSWVTGAKVFGLTKASCKKIKVPLPPLPEQQKIASILSGIDASKDAMISIMSIILRIKFTIPLILFVMILHHEFYNTEKNIHNCYN